MCKSSFFLYYSLYSVLVMISKPTNFGCFTFFSANIEARIKNKVIFKIYISGAAEKCTYFGLKAELWWPKLLRIGGSFPKRRPPRTIIFKTIMIFFCNWLCAVVFKNQQSWKAAKRTAKHKTMSNNHFNNVNISQMLLPNASSKCFFQMLLPFHTVTL